MCTFFLVTHFGDSSGRAVFWKECEARISNFVLRYENDRPYATD